MAEKLVSMKLSPKEGAKFAEAMTDPKPPEFPFGLEISLGEEQIKKMGISTLPASDTEMTLVAKVVVTSATDRTTDRQGEEKKKDRRIELQITEMSLGDKAPEPKADRGSNSDHATRMFGEDS